MTSDKCSGYLGLHLKDSCIQNGAVKVPLLLDRESRSYRIIEAERPKTSNLGLRKSST